MIPIVTLGFLMGLQHALEIDHLAAVSAMAGRGMSVARVIALGAAWGLGHTLTLFLVAVLALFSGIAPSGAFAIWLELGVGVMLLGLGGQVLYRLARDRIHFHAHMHSGAIRHLHAHSHLGDKGLHCANRHAHAHRRHVPIRALFVGMMHGLAGSAALLMLALANDQSPWMGLGYVLVFGIGSIVGMASLSAVISIPLALSARFLTWGNWTLQGLVGAGTLALGLWIVGHRWMEIAAS